MIPFKYNEFIYIPFSIYPCLEKMIILYCETTIKEIGIETYSKKTSSDLGSPLKIVRDFPRKMHLSARLTNPLHILYRLASPANR